MIKERHKHYIKILIIYTIVIAILIRTLPYTSRYFDNAVPCVSDFFLFFYDFPRSFKKFSDAGGLRYYGNRDFPTFLIPVQPGLHGLRPVEHQGLAAPAGHPHHLRVPGFADDHRTTALRLRLGH